MEQVCSKTKNNSTKFNNTKQIIKPFEEHILTILVDYINLKNYMSNLMLISINNFSTNFVSLTLNEQLMWWLLYFLS